MHVLTFLCQCLHKPASVKQNEDHPIDKKLKKKKDHDTFTKHLVTQSYKIRAQKSVLSQLSQG